jgi:hypothetical protein
LTSGIASLSPQGIDNPGHAMIDVVTTAGSAWEYHDGVGWTSIWSTNGVASAKAGQGVSYLLFTNGEVDAYDDATAARSYVYSGPSQIDAGTDRTGVNSVDMVAMVINLNFTFEHSDDSGMHIIAGGVQSISAGRQGISVYVSNGVAHLHNEVNNTDVAVYSNVSQAVAGTDANGDYMIDVLTTGGTLSEYRYGGSWTTPPLPLPYPFVTSLSKGTLDAVDMIFLGSAWQHTQSGWSYLYGPAAAAA